MRTISCEFNRNFVWYSIVIFIVFILLAIAVVQIGIYNHKIDLNHQAEFTDAEMTKISSYVNYHQYGGYGFSRMLSASPLFSLFFGSTTLDDLLAFIDSGVRFKMFKIQSGNNLFKKPTGGFFDLSWLFVIIYSLFIGFWGFFSFRNIEYIKYLSNFTKNRNVYLGIILGRIILIGISLSILFLVIVVQFLLNGFKFSLKELLGLAIFIFMTFLVWSFLLVFSALFGACKNWVRGASILFLFWLIIFLIWPGVLDLVFSSRASGFFKSAYSHELEKIKLLMRFEGESYDYVNRFNPGEDRIKADRFMGEKWWELEFPKIEKKETELLNQTQELSKSFHFFSIFNPVTFYKSTNNELSSKGYKAYISFCKKNQNVHRGFLRYFLDKKTYKAYDKVEPYLSKDAMVVGSKVSLPYYFFIGIILTLLFISIGLFFGFRQFKKFLFPKIQGKTENLDIALKNGEDVNVMIDKKSIDLIYNTLNGEIENIDGKISIDGKSIVTKDKKDYYYFPDVQALPGTLSITSIISLSKISNEIIIKGKRLKDLDFESRIRFFLNIAKSFKRDIYIFHLAVPSAYHELMKKLRDEFKLFLSEKSILIYFCPDNTVPLSGLKPKQSKMLMTFHGEIKYMDIFKFDD